MHRIARTLAALAAAAAFAMPVSALGAPEPIGVLYAHPPASEEPKAPPPPEPCKEDCYLLSSLVLRGSVTDGMTFELAGGVRAKETVKVPLFGPPGQVRLEDVTIDGSPAPVGFDGDHYFVFTSAPSFKIRGKIALGSDQMLAVVGPVVTVEAHLASGRLVEGERVGGVAHATLHFEDAAGDADRKPKAPPVFRLARALRFARETMFVYRVTASQSTDLGVVRVPLALGEKVGDVQGAAGWSVEGGELLLPTTGHEAEITISGTLPPSLVGGPHAYAPDPRCAYEWWLVEADPEHRVETAGEPKLVETSQSPIGATFPGARVFLVQKGQSLEIDARSLVRGDALAAVVRTQKRFVAITGRGELISDETLAYDNNGLDHVMVTPAGKAMFLSTDQSAQRILHTEAGARDVLVPVRAGGHVLRLQSLAEARLLPAAGVLAIPGATTPLATSNAEITIGLPENVHPLAVFGGDRARWRFGQTDLVAVLLGMVLACFGLRTARTRALGAACMAGAWFVSREAFVVLLAGLFFAGAVFLASRFLRGNALLLAGALTLVAALLGGKSGLEMGAPSHELFVERPDVPKPELSGGSRPTFSGDPKTDITPVSLSLPTSERYVQSSRQLVSAERPFVPRVVYVTSGLLTALELVWFALLGALAWAHRGRLLAWKEKIASRLARRPELSPDPSTLREAPPF